MVNLLIRKAATQGMAAESCQSGSADQISGSSAAAAAQPTQKLPDIVAIEITHMLDLLLSIRLARTSVE